MSRRNGAYWTKKGGSTAESTYTSVAALRKTSTYRRIWPERGEKTRLVEYRVLLLEPRHRGARAIVDTPSSHPRFHHIFHSVSRLIHMLLLMKPTRQFQLPSPIFHLRQHLNHSAWEKEFGILLD